MAAGIDIRSVRKSFGPVAAVRDVSPAVWARYDSGRVAVLPADAEPTGLEPGG